MKDHIITQLVSDPEFNPVEWLGDAIKAYIINHPSKVLSNSLYRSYIFRAMECRDTLSIAKSLPDDLGIIKEFLNCLNDIKPDESGATGYEAGILFKARARVASRLYELAYSSNCPQYDACKLICDIKDLETIPFIEGSLPIQDLLNGLKNWNKSKIEPKRWMGIANIIPEEQFSKFLDIIQPSDFFSNIARARASDWPYNFQSIIMRFLQKTPDYALSNWSSLIGRFNKWSREDKKNRPNANTFGIATIYSHRQDYRSDRGYFTIYDKRVKKSINRREPVQITDLMCRCGHVAHSKSGITLHRKNSENQYCQKTPLIVAYRIRMAKARLSYDCPQCGKPGKSFSGQINHKIGCQKLINVFDTNEVLVSE